MPRVLSLSTLYPNGAQPRFGTFVARSLEALQRETDWEVTVINPIGVAPLALGRYRAKAAAAVDGIEHGVPVHRPTFHLLPGIGGRLNPRAIAGAAIAGLAPVGRGPFFPGECSAATLGMAPSVKSSAGSRCTRRGE